MMISIKEGKLIPKKEPDNYVFSIDDPFDLYHNPGKTLLKSTANATKVRELMKKAYLSTLQGFHLVLD